ncbi:Os04g0383700 [Oryza sativa Japonica Group]|jgi:hypothetical protein|uniref:Os04g0383700 protein n=4 Tax=Oryza TaxID=4527 RepID=A0A0P0W9V5_ORYSJ|nr:hypothetical protein OsI_15635 [Oryza sativa Indica Group]EAZ30496.1 hypothetical protein OsJ_14541 [Oryza sativa Japonica Group]KAF2933674.1 hypothetical protein DAI22_04g103400 [Oryza sativa Japonica Group]CAE05287.2 OSJNBa0084N21.5 [Oryza sativa Japonica Group]BAF14526.1 Os04g0383700 [Oryza sativa Japonica Group]|eukprot:NP_001052612.1 Os04g0383700 [Oryza sativa Japonica Group]
MERKATIACCLLLLAVDVAATGAVPAAAWMEDDTVGIDLQLQAAPLAMVLAAAAGGGVDDDHELHRRVLQARGGYVDPSLVADRQRCIGSCSRPGRPYTGRGNLCIFQNRSC